MRIKLQNRRRVILAASLIAVAVCVVHITYAQQFPPSGPAGASAPAPPLPPGGMPSAAPPAAVEQVFRVIAPQAKLNLIERFAKVVELPTRIARVDGFDPEVVTVTALSPNQLRVAAGKPGVTTMVLTDENGAMYAVEIFVAGDVRHLQATLDRLFPHAAVEVVAIREAVVVRGWVTQPEQITQIVEVAERFTPNVLNQMKVGGTQQVLLKVKVMEVQRSKIRRMGFNFLYFNQDGYLASTPGSLVPVGSIGSPLGGPASLTAAAAALADPIASFGLVGDNNVFNGFLDALKQEGLLTIKAEPQLVTTSGRPASLLNGGEFPILVPQSLGSVTIEYREFGTQLEFVPIVLGKGRLRLEVSPEVSERDFTNSVTVNGLTVPGITTRRVNTQVEMNFGQTLMIAGLIANRRTASTSKVPLFGELPWIGTAFSRKRYDEVETELVVMVTPEYVGAVDSHEIPCGGPGQFTDTPTDRELYFYNHIEVPRYGDECAGGPCQNPFRSCDAAGRPILGGPPVSAGQFNAGPIAPGGVNGIQLDPQPNGPGMILPQEQLGPEVGPPPFPAEMGLPPAPGAPENDDAGKDEGEKDEGDMNGTAWNPESANFDGRRGSTAETQSVSYSRSPQAKLNGTGSYEERPGLIAPKPGLIEPPEKPRTRRLAF